MLNKAIYCDPSPTWAQRAAFHPMAEYSWDTDEDAALSDKIEMGEATQKEIEYMEKKYGKQW